MDFSFILPLNNEDLLNDAVCTNYYVKRVYNADEIPSQLRAAHQALQTGDAFYIFDHFDTFFSVIESISQLQMIELLRPIEILYRTTENLGQLLGTYLNQSSLDRQKDFLNLTKMVMYLLVTIVKATDVFVKKKLTQMSATGQKNRSNDDQLPQYANYGIKRTEILVQICNIVNLPIEKLWNMSMIEDDFVNLLCDLAYRSLSHPSTKEKGVINAIFHILGTAIKKYRHGIAFPVQIVQIMDREESVVSPIAHGVRYLNDEFRITSVVRNLLEESINKVAINPGSQTISKNLSLFITEIGEISPQLSLQCLEVSRELLGLEPFGVRSSIFGLMNNVIINHLSGEGLDDDQRTLRDEYMEDMCNHVNDTNSSIRSKVLQIWNELKSRNAVQLAWILRIVTRAVERLEDKTATVRKHAIILLKSFLESNPFSAQLCLDDVEQKLVIEVEKTRIIHEKAVEQERKRAEVSADIKARCTPILTPIFLKLLREEQDNSNAATRNGLSDEELAKESVQKVRDLLNKGEWETLARYMIRLDRCNLEARSAMPFCQQAFYFIVLITSYMFDDYALEIAKQDLIVRFLEVARDFSKAIAQAVPKLELLLLSSTPSDVLEAIEFFKAGYLFNIKGTQVGMRMMLRLLYINTGQEKNEKGEAVIRAYHSILFHTDAVGRAHHLKVVDNLYNFLQTITNGEYTAFGLMIKHWILSDDININVINILFERFTLKLAGTSIKFARCCMELLILVSNAKPAVAHSNMKLIIDIMNSKRILQDPRIFSGCLELLMRSIDIDKVNRPSASHKRFADTEVIKSIIITFEKFFFFPNLPDFELIATKSIDFLYKMCYAPDSLCQNIIHDICKKLNEISERQAANVMDVSEDGVESSPSREIYIPKYLLPRIIFIFGYIASKELAYLDNDVYLNLKHRETLNRGKEDANNNASNEGNASASASETSKQEQDEAYMGATAEDALAEMINGICENQLIGSADGLLHHILPILSEILRHPERYKDQLVQRLAVLTLLRFMIVSSSFCSNHIGLLMYILNKTKDASVKCNIIIGLADLISRFANIIEPWIPNYYMMLLETDETVRLTAVGMLSHVILQSIVRVTGQVSNIAICIVDENPEIREAARYFFCQLVKSKELDYYRIMPDIVSRLSSSQSPIAEDKFRNIMTFMLELIQKERQVEKLVDKLCGRFRNTNTERQWRDVAFCLSVMNHTEKTMRKLIDHSPNYKDKVKYDDIYDCFKTIISNANRRSTKVELKNLAGELDRRITACFRFNGNGDDSVEEEKRLSSEARESKRRARGGRRK